ncbi:MAG: helix-turn-helix domain-containing protein [Chloroflexota bacterium]
MARRIDPKSGYPIDVLNPDCPSHHTLGLLTDKWSMCIVITLSRRGRLRTSQIKRALGVSSKMLAQTLRKLERCGIVSRETYDEMPPRVEYDLTDLVITLLEPICALADWAETHYDTVLTSIESAEAEEASA